MEIKQQELLQIKKTKGIAMYGNKDYVRIVSIQFGEEYDYLEFPINKVPQLVRGLFSYYQRFHKRGYVKKR